MLKERVSHVLVFFKSRLQKIEQFCSDKGKILDVGCATGFFLEAAKQNECDIYGSQLLKIRANVRFDDQLVYGRWINCTSPLKINITAFSTFAGFDSSGKSMCPHSYNSSHLDYPIEDIWLIKKDNEKGRPWCKIIGHAEPNENLAVVTFEDYDVQPNDFYWVAIRQKGQELRPGENEYMAFIGPIFIENVL